MEPKKRIWIVGGSSGIGLELVKLCINSDYLVIVSSRNASKSEVLIKLKEDFPSKVSLLDIDVSSKDDISKKVEKDHHAIILMDRASWHTTEALNIPSNITIFPLPPYSPELNPMEQVWQKIKEKKLTNKTFKNYDDIVNCCVDAWNSFCDEDGNIESLCTRSWAK